MKKIKVFASRKVTAAADSEYIHPALESFENEAYRFGYDVTFQGDSLENVSIELTARDDDLPKLTVWLDCSEMQTNGVVYFECKAKFDDIDTRKLEFADSAQYIVKQHKKAADFITYMMRNPIILANWKDDEE